jgi:putative phosphotransacetylase
VTFDNVAVRAKDDYALDFHIDIDEANAAWAKPGDRAEIVT